MLPQMAVQATSMPVGIFYGSQFPNGFPYDDLRAQVYAMCLHECLGFKDLDGDFWYPYMPLGFLGPHYVGKLVFPA